MSFEDLSSRRQRINEPGDEAELLLRRQEEGQLRGVKTRAPTSGCWSLKGRQKNPQRNSTRTLGDLHLPELKSL